jgi:2-amino-4-hydroxy-6-hydroxymethyldihydropteridine diphosphokinase
LVSPDGRVFVGIGSNMGTRIEHCARSVHEIARDPRVKPLALSSFYLTSPVSAIPQGDFINCAFAFTWEGSPLELLALLMGIENTMGRQRGARDGPRTIDLDILLFGNQVIESPSLVIPHPGLHRRRFAMVPCLEIDPELVHPLYKKPLRAFLEAIIGESQGILLFQKTDLQDLLKAGNAAPATGRPL